MKKIKIGVILPGLGYINRGNEVAYIEYIKQLAQKPDLEIYVFGAGKQFNPPNNVRYVRVPCLMRHNFDNFPKIKRLHLTHNHDWENAIFSIVLSFIFLFSKFQIDIFLFSTFPFVLLPLKIYKKFKNKNVKVVFNSGGGSAFMYSRFFFADRVTATDPSSTEFYGKKFKTIRISSGVDTNLFRPRPEAREVLNLPKDKFIVFSASAFDKIKRIDFLIRAASMVNDSLVILAGAGVERKNLEDLGRKLLGSNVVFLGAIDQNILAQYYAACDVSCLFSEKEPFGNVLVEAMASETPVITNNSPIQKWMVGDGGSCVDVTDQNILVKELEKYKDKTFRSLVGRKARQNVIDKFSWVSAGEQYHKLFKELAAEQSLS